jgi:hypothetical protein
MSDTRDPGTGREPISLPQGALGLLESEVAQRLFSSRIPARLAYLASDGTPRVLATWFHWTGEAVVMPTFLAAPHVRHPPRRLRSLRANPHVTVMIDTETFPPEVLTLRGPVEITEVDGVPPEYAEAARRYLGEEAAREYLEQIDRPGTRMARIELRPNWVGVHDFRSRLPSALGGIA